MTSPTGPAGVAAGSCSLLRGASDGKNECSATEESGERSSHVDLSDVLQNTTLGMYFLKNGKFLAPTCHPRIAITPKSLRTKDTGRPAA